MDQMKEATCDNCGTSFDVGATIYDCDEYSCPECGCSVSATVYEDGSYYWTTYDGTDEEV